MNNEKFMNALFRFHDMLEEDFIQFAADTEKAGLDEGRLCYADTFFHLFKNLWRVITAEEGEEEYTDGGVSGDQGYGRAIRTTPGLGGGYSGANGGGQTGNGRSMRGGTAMRGGGRTAYSGSGMRSGKRDSMGRYSGAAEQEIFDKLRKMADMTADHDEREYLNRTIDRLKAEEDE